MPTLQFETTVGADGTITLPTSRYDATEYVNKPVRVVVDREWEQERLESRLKKLVGEELFGSVIACGDIITPIDEVWEQAQ